jgi:hypothetical protein
MPDFANLTEVLKWLAAGGGSIVIAAIASYAAEHSAAFQALSAMAKRVVAIVGGGLIGVAAWAVVTYVPAEVLQAIAPAYTAFMLSAVGALAGQVAHAVRQGLSMNKFEAVLEITDEKTVG